MNIRDIARLANVTPGTVSKVLNNYPDISESTRQTVLKIIEEYQYKPNSNARMLKLATRAPQIGLILEGVENSIYTILEELLSIRLHNANYTIISFHDNYFVQDKSEKFQELTSYINQHKLSGLVYVGGNFESLTQKQFNMLSCPTIFVNTVLPPQFGETQYSSIQVNHHETAYQQMNYLIQKGHKHICTMISSKQDNSVYNLRTKAYKLALQEHGLTNNFSHILESDYTCCRAYNELFPHLKQHPEITAICCATDMIIPAVLRSIHDVGKAAGKDIDVISFDGMDIMNYCIPSVTTFSQPVQELANCIYDLLLGLIANEREHQHITFQTKFIQNESC